MAPSLRTLPSVDRLVADPRLVSFAHPLAVLAARSVLLRAREVIRDDREPADLVEGTLAELAVTVRPSLRRVLNASGVLIHTNLDRAPLAKAALDRVVEVGGSYSNLEYDLEAGARGSRQDHLGALLRRVVGGEGSMLHWEVGSEVLLCW